MDVAYLESLCGNNMLSWWPCDLMDPYAGYTGISFSMTEKYVEITPIHFMPIIFLFYGTGVT